MFDTTNIRVAI